LVAAKLAISTSGTMSGEGRESIPTSADPRSKRPTKRRALTPTSSQAKDLDALFAKPDQPVRLPPSAKELEARAASRGGYAPPEIVTNVQGSSAGAGSGEFHVYKAARRREYERLRAMDVEKKREDDREDFERSKEERETQDEEKTRKNRERRERAKARKAKGKGSKQNGGHRSEEANGHGENKWKGVQNGVMSRKVVNEAEDTPTSGGNLAETADGEQRATTSPVPAAAEGLLIHDDD
jgi:hypothetical protein